MSAIRLRAWHLDETNERRSYDWTVPNEGELDAQLVSLGRTVASGALIECRVSSGFLYAYPASRFLFVERLPS